jgi:hypothetical protein
MKYFIALALAFLISHGPAHAGNMTLLGTGVLPAAGCAQATTYLARTTGGNEGGNATNITTLICGLVTDGVITGNLSTTGCGAPLDVLYVLAQQNSTDALLNLCSSSYTATPTGSPAFTTFRGYVFNGGNYDLDSGFNAQLAPSPHIAPNSASFGVWSDAVVTETTPQLSSINNNFIYISFTGSLFFPRVTNGSGGSIPTPGSEGLFVGDRSSSANIVPYWNGAAQTTITSGSTGSEDNHDFLVGGSGAATGTAQTLSEVHIGASLGATLNLALYTRLRTYMTAVGVP